MNKLLTITLATMFSIPAGAATQCVWLNPDADITCTTDMTMPGTEDYENYPIDWSARCTIKKDGVSKTLDIRGVAHVANTQGGSSYYITDTITAGLSNANNCWCKMTSPAVSKWIYVGHDGGTYNCAYLCANTLTQNSCGYNYYNNDYRDAMFSNFQ